MGLDTVELEKRYLRDHPIAAMAVPTSHGVVALPRDDDELEMVKRVVNRNAGVHVRHEIVPVPGTQRGYYALFVSDEEGWEFALFLPEESVYMIHETGEVLIPMNETQCRVFKFPGRRGAPAPESLASAEA